MDSNNIVLVTAQQLAWSGKPKKEHYAEALGFAQRHIQHRVALKLPLYGLDTELAQAKKELGDLR
ncbi:hypothetical protein [Pseudoalteromonas rubra]|uniref:Uncharacterized protein n=1 Tax=Pseudoalteromonas rubra TaxID=43658 RepID=A0A0U3IET1_9GAMM|nr:hypothetical protein [Pseudoalteromonas rubra]ALU41916.1 hypothetical protein AT705_02615 [Pseudoalteromonas rubra]